MTKKLKRMNPEQLHKKLLDIIVNFEYKLNQGVLRDQVLSLVPAHTILFKLGSSLMDDELTTSAKARILSYLLKHTRLVVKGEELMVVAGISEYARRIRELRVQEGWPVVTGSTLKKMVEEGEITLDDLNIKSESSLKASQYMLLNDECDREAAHRWNSANRIRKSNGSVKDKILAYFCENVGNYISGEELQYLAPNAKEWARRVRELRTEEGWPIATRNSGYPDLPVGFYILEKNRQAPRHDRVIPDMVRVEVLERDDYKCRHCNWSYESKRKGDPRVMLELHHINYHKDGGKNIASNLISLCNVCHDSVHRNEISKEHLFSLII